ncbi:MAG TPA: hypothetical protein PLS69_12380, partial [Terricaulis sp.]|nr:hypothetical protein [Terricaulis sp.]
TRRRVGTVGVKFTLSWLKEHLDTEADVAAEVARWSGVWAAAEPARTARLNPARAAAKAFI